MNKKLIVISIIGIITLGFFYFLYKKYDTKQNTKNEIQAEQQDLTKPATTNEFEKLSEKAYEYLSEQQKIIEEKYGIGKYEKWFYDQETGYLTFSDGDTVKIKIKYEEVGSISKVSETWLWSWANPHLEDKIKTDILQVKKYGQENNLELLTKRKWYGDKYDGWEMTAISAYILNAKGAYRVPTEKTFAFMIFKEVIDLRTK